MRQSLYRSAKIARPGVQSVIHAQKSYRLWMIRVLSSLSSKVLHQLLQFWHNQRRRHYGTNYSWCNLIVLSERVIDQADI